jgi:L-alanine-DL-glutamate epimerase-like enolase superfamily enzyme
MRHPLTRRNWAASAAAPLASAAGVKIERAEAFLVRIPYDARVRENMLDNYRRENMNRPDYRTWIVRLWGGGLVAVGEGGQPAQDPRPRLASLQGRSPWEFLHDVSLGPATLVAMYDLAAQSAGLPVSRLFSPNPRPTIRQIWWSHCLRPKLMQAEARRGLEAGYTIHKTKARPYESPAEQVAAIAEVVPHDYQVLVDANGTFESAEHTLAVAKSLERFFQVKGMEQPIAHENVLGYRRLHAELPMRLAVHWEAVDVPVFVREALVDAFVVEDWLWGPPLMRKNAVCEFSGQKMWVENGLHTGISQAFQAHMAAACPAVEYTISLTHVAEDDLVNEPFTVARGGIYTVPDKPGLGVTLDDKAAARYRLA